MATYPDNLYEPRNFENLPGLNRLTADKKNLYAEDLNETNAEIVAIETILGKNPNGAYASVKAWLEDLASGGGGGTWGTITGTLNDQLDLASALSNKQDSLIASVLGALIYGYTTKSSPVSGDYFVIRDSNGGSAKKVSLSNLVYSIASLGGAMPFGYASFSNNNYDFEIDPFVSNPFDGLVLTGFMGGTNTGAITISINGGTPRACRKLNGTKQLEAGDIVNGGLCMFQYFNNGDGTYWQMLTPSAKEKANADNVLALNNTTAFTPDNDYEPATKKYVDDNAGGNMPALKVFTSSGTYYPSSGVKYIEVEAVGGGGGGGKSGGGASNLKGGSGGGAGGYAKKIISVDDLGESETITIGSGGAGDSSGGVGGTGGRTYFGSILSAGGGTGGRYNGGSTGNGGSGTGGDINIGGQEGHRGGNYGCPGSGGLSFLGVLGAGGNGGASTSNGYSGKSGVVIIKEFF